MSSVNAVATNNTIADLYGQVKSENLKLQPEFQRKFVWNTRHQKTFIETILKGLPFPEIYIADSGVDIEKISTQKVVVDGQQRLSTIIQYIDGEIPIETKDEIIEYAKLATSAKKAFLNYLVVIRQLGDVNSDTIKEIFRRINLTRYALNAYEIHHAIYDGEYIGLAQSLADNSDFKALPTFSEADNARMQDMGFALLVITTYEVGGYFTGDKEIEGYIKKFNNNYPTLQATQSKLFSTVKLIKNLNLKKDSTWFRKSNLFTLFIELAMAESIPKDLESRLLEFEKKIQNNKDSNKDDDYSKYYSYMYSGTNRRLARVERSRIFKENVMYASSTTL